MAEPVRSGLVFATLDPGGTQRITWATSFSRRASGSRGQETPEGRTGFWHGRRTIHEPNPVSERFRDLMDSGAVARVAPGMGDWISGTVAVAYAGDHPVHLLEAILLVTKATGRPAIRIAWDFPDGRWLDMDVVTGPSLGPYEPWELTEAWHEHGDAPPGDVPTGDVPAAPDLKPRERPCDWLEMYLDAPGLREDRSTAALAYLFRAAVGITTASCADLRFIGPQFTADPPDQGMILFPLEDASGVVTGVIRHWLPIPGQVGTVTPRPDLRQGRGVFRVLAEDGTGGPVPIPGRPTRQITICNHPLDALVLVESGPGWKGQATFALAGQDLPRWLLLELETVRVRFAHASGPGSACVTAAERTFQDAGLTVTRLVPPGNARTFAEARLAEWTRGYRPGVWPPPDPDGKVPDGSPVRLPADWWTPVAVATGTPIRQMIPRGASGCG